MQFDELTETFSQLDMWEANEAFQTKFGFSAPNSETDLDQDLKQFRVNFLYEEVKELYEAKNDEDVIDALVDIAVIALGTYWLHGFERFKLTRITNEESKPDFKLYDEMRNGTNGALLYKIHCYETSLLPEMELALINIIDLCMIWANVLGFHWDTHWNEVFRCNMNKVRAPAASDSKRGSAYDIIKPEGWKGPNHARYFVHDDAE